MRGERGWLVGAMLVMSMVGGAVSNAWLTTGLGAQVGDVVTAAQVNIVDAEGQLRAVLAGADERGQTSLAFYAPDGSLRGLIGVEQDGNPLVRLNDASGATRFQTTVRDTTGLVTVGDATGRHVVVGGFGDRPLVGLSDGTRTPLQLTLGGQSQPQVSLLNSTGQRSLGLVVGADDASFLSIYDAAGSQRLALGTVQGATVVNLGDGTRPRLVLGVADNGRASLAFYDADGAVEREVSAVGR
ncbi:MAG: hypothetical protein VYE68_16700 [Acidobacteriota bacterium]|nr:hypothetical protein [Acidobacteriota bacterium]